MKNLLNLTLLIVLFVSCTAQNTSYEDEIKQFQYKLNTEFADAATSPLTPEDLKTFKKLDFFPIAKKGSISPCVPMDAKIIFISYFLNWLGLGYQVYRSFLSFQLFNKLTD